MDTGRLRRGGNVDGRHEDRVDDVDDAVGGLHVSKGDGGRTNGHAAAAVDGELELVTVGRGRHHAVLDVASGHFSGHDVMEQDLGQGFVFLGRVEVVEVNTSVDEGLVGGCEHGVGSGSLEHGHQVGVRQRCHERIVHARRCGVGGDVLRGVCRGAERKGGSGQEGNNQKGQRLVHIPVD